MIKQKTNEKIIKERLWTRPDNYIGPDHFDSIRVLSRSRDSEILEISNFECALEMLGGESESVEIIRDSHWAFGWIETIRVSLKNKKTLDIAINIIKKIKAYPILDDDHYFEMEQEAMHEWAEDHKHWNAEQLAKTLELKIKTSNKSLLDLAYHLELEHQINNGIDSTLDFDDIEQIKYTLEQVLENKAIKITNLLKRIAAQLGLSF